MWTGRNLLFRRAVTDHEAVMKDAVSRDGSESLGQALVSRVCDELDLACRIQKRPVLTGVIPTGIIKDRAKRKQFYRRVEVYLFAGMCGF